VSELERPNGLTAQLAKKTVDAALAVVPAIPATGDLAIARQAAAEVARDEGGYAYARFILHGRFDDEPEVRAALTALRLAQTNSNGSGGTAEQAPPVNK